MKKIVLVLLAVLLIPTHAFAYSFSVKVVNKTGGDLAIDKYVTIYAKGSGHMGTCSIETAHAATSSLGYVVVKNNDNAQFTTCPLANAQKWQRAVTVQFTCDRHSKTAVLNTIHHQHL